MDLSSVAGRRVALALSGGVDSAVAAALLKERGADLQAVTMQLKDDDDLAPASETAAFLGIPHRIVDLREAFRVCVVEPFADAYLCGQTPNPCAMCNKKIKFGALQEIIGNMGAEFLASGHYARRQDGPEGPELHRGADTRRDQSYFLFDLSRDQLARTLFPLGDLTKDSVRRIAREKGIPVADRKDSQDICFVPHGDYKAVLRTLRPGASIPGRIVDQNGHPLGRHKGIESFTVGQRKGLNLSARRGEDNEPLYVIKINAETNEVVVGPHDALLASDVFLRRLNWLAGEVPQEGLPVDIQLRSTQPPAPALFFKEGGDGRIVLKTPVFGISPGQAGVIYHNTRVLGGGVIEAL